MLVGAAFRPLHRTGGPRSGPGAGSPVAPGWELCYEGFPASGLPGSAEPAPRKGEMCRRPSGPRRRLGRLAGSGGGGPAGEPPGGGAQGAGQRPRAAAGSGKARGGGKGRICSAEETQMAAAQRHSGPGAGSQQPCPHRGPPAAAKYPDAPPERQTRSWEKRGSGGGDRARARARAAAAAAARRRTDRPAGGAGPGHAEPAQRALPRPEPGPRESGVRKPIPSQAFLGLRRGLALLKAHSSTAGPGRPP